MNHAGPFAAANSAGPASLSSSTTLAPTSQVYEAYRQQAALSTELQHFAGHGSPHAFNQPQAGLSPHMYGQDASVMKGGLIGPTSFPAQQQQQQQQQQAQQQFGGQQPFIPSYSSAQYPTPTPTSSAQTVASVRQSNSRSPQQSDSPASTRAGAFQQPPPQQPTPPSKYPMAAPPLPQTPSAPAVASPLTPLSPATQTREQQRVALLLDINIDLLQEVNRLQSEGKGGALSAQQQAQLKSQGMPDTLASEEYIQCLRRVQGNLAYMGNMAPRAGGDASKILPGPAIMTPPPHLAGQLGPKYDRLKDLFPGWPGHTQKLATQTTQGANPNGMNNMSPGSA